jgi:hypothetical protein
MEIMKSRKMVYFLATLIVAAVGSFTGVDPEVVEKIIYLGMVTIGGQSLADGWSGGKTSLSGKTKPEA